MSEPSQPPGRQVDRGDLEERKAILESLYRGLISSQLAADMIAALTLKGDDLEHSLFDTWHTIIGDAKESSDRHVVLSELLADVAHLPPVKDEEGKQRTIYDLRIWGESCLIFEDQECTTNSLAADDLPTFSWELNEDWRPRMLHYGSYSPPALLTTS